jgi:hypothetical protein
MPSEARACQQQVTHLARSSQISLCVRPDTVGTKSALRGMWEWASWGDSVIQLSNLPDGLEVESRAQFALLESRFGTARA